MWYLKSEHDGSLFYLLAGKTYTIRRKVGDLVLPEDQSISRTHGVILISNEGEVFIWDEGSKYGTFVFEGDCLQKLEPEERTKIEIGDKVRFGLQRSVYVLGKMSFLVCASSISVEEKRLLYSILQKIGGSFSNEWNKHCTHLAMNQVSLTHKLVLTLAAGKPVTTVQYWKKMEEAISNQLELPKIEDYLPPVGEEELQRQTSPDTLLPSENRKSLFQGKVFVFSSEDGKNKVQPLVECGGGVFRSFQTLKSPSKVCCEPNYIVVKESEMCKQIMPDIFAALKRKGLRAIPLSEIGLAIYNNSLSRYCNPSWRKPVILGGPPSQSQGVCLVENTEDVSLNSQDIKTGLREDIVIPPSLGSVCDTSIGSCRSGKRPLSTSPEDNPPPKRLVQQKDAAKKDTQTVEQRLQRSGSSATGESEATCSFNVSRGDLFATKSQSTRSDETATPKSSKNETDVFKKPSPKKSSGVKRGRTEDDDIFDIPSPKKTSTAGKAKKTTPINDVNRKDDKLDETIEDDSDDEFELPSRKKATPARIEDDDDDEFQLPSSSSKKSKRMPSITISATAKTTNWPNEDEHTSEETTEISFAAPAKVVSRNESKMTESRVKARTAESRVEATTTDPGPVLRIETSTMLSVANGRVNISHAPPLAEFLDKSDGVPIKKEEDDDEIDREILKINYEIEEMTLRKRSPLRDMSTNSDVDKRPNFKKFRKTRPPLERTRIDLVVDDDISLFEPVPDPDNTIANGHRDHGEQGEVTASQDVQSVFPFTNNRNGPSRQSRLRRVPDSDIFDDWTIP